MARDVEDLVLSISADTAQIRRALKKLESDTKRSTSVMERNFASMNAGISRSAVAMGRSLALAFGGAVTLRGAQQLIDASIRIQNALKVTGLEGEALTKVYDELFASAQRNYVPLETLTTLYSRLGLAQKELGINTAEMLNFTDKIGLALRVQGTGAAEARGALIQLTQALGGGVVRAEEFNSILEGAPTIARAAAAGLKEAGGSVAALRTLIINGEVSSQAFFRAFEAGADILEGQVANAEQTVSQGFVRLQNVLTDTAGKLNEGSGASERLAGVLESLSDTIASTDFSPVINGILDIGNAAVSVIGTITQLASEIGRLSGIQQAFQNRISRDALSKNFKDQIRTQLGGGNERIEDAFAITSGTGEGLAERGGRVAPRPAAAVVPISLSDYAAPAKAGGGGKGRAGGRDKAAAAAKREADAVKELIADLEHERSVIGLTDEQRRVSEALRKAGAAATDEQKAKIGELVSAIEQEEAAMDRLKASQQEVNDLSRDVLGGMISDLKSGTSAADALENALSRVADRLLDIGLDSLFGGKGGGLFGGGKGLLGGSIIPGILHSGGTAGRDGYGHGRSVSPAVFAGATRYHNGGVAGLKPDEVPAILQRGEVVIPKGAKGGASSVHVTVGVDVDKSGNLTPFVTSISDQRAQVRSQQAMQQSAAQFPQLQQDRQRRTG